MHLRGRVYDPKLGRFLSPDPAPGAATDPQSQNGYAYARNNPLSLVDPSGYTSEQPPSSPAGDEGSFGAWLGAAWHAVATIASGFATGVVGTAASFLATSWGGIRFAATASWNGIGWAGNQLAGAASALGRKAWDVYNDDFQLGILPDKRVPFGLPQSIALGFMQWRYQQLELWDVRYEGDEMVITHHEGPIAGNVRVNGQQTSLERAALGAIMEAGRQPCILAYNASVNLVSDTVESALMKFAPSAASIQLANLLTHAEGPVHISGHSQGTLTLFWALRLADRRLDDVTVDFFGPATSSLAYSFALARSGAKPGAYGYFARVNDPVATFIGGNFTGGWALPLLLPGRFVFSAESIPLLPFTNLSPHSSYP